ncbi:MAG: diaminopimelate decarboxylase [Finegoldia sp.]|nr:diaminopimelate decarboxylase [Finegoldia sp.]
MQKNFSNIDGVLHIGGVSVKDLKEKYGTPLYIYDQKLFKDTARTFLNNFKSDRFDTEVVYASKACSNLYMIGLVKSLGLDLDVVSGGELFTALKASMNPAKIHFHGNNKLADELEMAVVEGVGSIIVDNVAEYERLSVLGKKYKKQINVLLRINPDVKADTHKHIQTSNPDSKFGMHVLQAETKGLIERMLADEYVNLEGFHAHIGSQVVKGEFFFEESDIVLEYTRDMQRDFNHKFSKVNFGGGFGVSHIEGDASLDLESFLKAFISHIEEKLDDFDLDIKTVSIEPGRSMVNGAGSMLYTIGTIKETQEGLPFVFVDGGMSDNIRPSLYDGKYEAFIANKMDLPRTERYRVGGKLCESGDILIKDTIIQEPEVGDLLLIPSTGAYTYSMASNYNRVGKAAVVFVEDGKDFEAVKRESFEDLISHDNLYKES